jgi:orotate phosphoribosyltransferase
MTDSKSRLLDLLREKSFRRGTFTLTSGKTSDFFIDCKPTVLSAEGHALVGELLLDAASRVQARVDAVAGVELGGCPLASAVSLTSFRAGRPLDAVYVRKQAKGHGTKKLLEGADRLAPGAGLLVLEDTVTTGGSTLRAVESIREHGFEVVGVLAIVDRSEGGAEAIRDAGLHFEALFRRADFMGEGA